MARRCSALNTGLRKPVAEREPIGRGVAVILRPDYEEHVRPRDMMKVGLGAATLY
jgi:hypothetical protein